MNGISQSMGGTVCSTVYHSPASSIKWSSQSKKGGIWAPWFLILPPHPMPSALWALPSSSLPSLLTGPLAPPPARLWSPGCRKVRGGGKTWASHTSVIPAEPTVTRTFFLSVLIVTSWPKRSSAAQFPRLLLLFSLPWGQTHCRPCSVWGSGIRGWDREAASAPSLPSRDQTLLRPFLPASGHFSPDAASPLSQQRGINMLIPTLNCFLSFTSLLVPGNLLPTCSESEPGTLE